MSNCIVVRKERRICVLPESQLDNAPYGILMVPSVIRIYVSVHLPIPRPLIIDQFVCCQTTRCHLQKSVPRYLNPHHHTDKQNAFALLGIDPFPSTLLDAQISKGNLPLHLHCLRPSKSQSAPSLKKTHFGLLVVSKNKQLR